MFDDEVDDYGSCWSSCMEEKEVLERHNAFLKKALEFYADYANWHPTYSRLEVSAAVIDKGDMARAILKKYEKRL